MSPLSLFVIPEKAGMKLPGGFVGFLDSRPRGNKAWRTFSYCHEIIERKSCFVSGTSGATTDGFVPSTV
jgi:hypothetical protein